MNLFIPSGNSINDAISPAYSSFHYVTVLQVVELILQGSCLTKIDLKAAFRRVPVHSADQHHLGISWRDHNLCNRALPFGLRSAPIIFNTVADGLTWAMICSNIIDLAHNLDNFIFLSPTTPLANGLSTLLFAQPPDLGSQLSQPRSRVPRQPLPFSVSRSTPFLESYASR